MSLITKKHLSLLLQTIKKLLSFKIDRSEIATEEDTMELITDLGYVTPVTSSSGEIYTDNKGNIISL